MTKKETTQKHDAPKPEGTPTYVRLLPYLVVATGLAVSTMGWMLRGGSEPLATIPAQGTPTTRAAEATAGTVDAVVYLIGDAGAPAAEREPVLVALQRLLAENPKKSVAVFLGDNVYPSGLPEEGHESRKESQRRLDAQIEVIKQSGARGIFIPGNHDWGGVSGKDGWNTAVRQGEYIRAQDIETMPEPGCPGPSITDVGTVLRLVIFDSQWWLRRSAPPDSAKEDKPCAFAAQDAVIDSLKSVLRSAGTRRIVLLSHHPLTTGGVHGGHFTARNYVFPLTGIKRSLRIPLPMVGAAYVKARQAGISEQDLSSSRYRSLINQLEKSFSATEPLIYAAGHEHNLQVMAFTEPPYYHLVSGSGIYGHVSAVRPVAGTRYSAALSGFMQLQAWSDGRVHLSVFTVDQAGQPKEVFSEWVIAKPTRPTRKVSNAS